MKGLFWGLLTIDLHFFTDYFPAENSKVKASKFHSYVGGPATNGAITFSHLGGKSQLVTAIGKNPYKSMIFEELDEYVVDIYDAKSKEIIDPVFASIITNENSGSRTIFSYMPKEPEIQPINVIDANTEIALFDGFYMKSAVKAARWCKQLGITTVFDGGSWKAGTDELLKYIDVAICSEDFYPPGISSNEEVTEYLLKKGVQKTAITRGQRPIITNEGEVNFLIEVPSTEIVDTLGAGDIFHGAFCYFYASMGNFLVALEKAAQVASFSCKYAGPRNWMRKD
jgi:sugar/nucleoside kinase (ribokinase family)